jgi:uncharacterized protein (UPF0335 family)
MSKKVLAADLNTNDSKERLKEIAQSVQTIDEEIFDLAERRKEILKSAKDEGFNDKLIRQAISIIRKPANDLEEMEQEVYVDVLSEIINPLK